MNFSVQLRDKTGKGANRKLRAEGMAPGIIYGISDPQPVKMRSDLALRFIKSFAGGTRVINLTVESGDASEQKMVILQDYQLSAFGRKLIHADFLEVTNETKVTLEVPIHLVNEEMSPAVKEGGTIQVIRWTVPVKCAVKNIQEAIEIDVKDMNFGDSIHVLDLDYDEGVEPIVYGRNFTIVTVAGRIEEEPEEGEEELEALAEDSEEEAGASEEEESESESE